MSAASPLRSTSLPVAGAAVYLAGIAATALALRSSGRGGLAVRRPIVTLGYRLALLNVAIGATLGMLDIAGWEPVVSRWSLLRPAHAWTNLVGFVSLVIVSTLLHFLPTVLATRIVPRSSAILGVGGIAVGSPIVVAGLAIPSSPLVAAGCASTLVGASAVALEAFRVARARGRWTTDRGWHLVSGAGLLAGIAWFEVGLVLAVGRVVSAGPGTSGWSTALVGIPLAIGWVVQVLIASWTHLLPSIGGGGPPEHARQRAILGRAARTRLVLLNAGVATAAIGWPASAGPALGAGLAAIVAAILWSVWLVLHALRVRRDGASPTPRMPAGRIGADTRRDLASGSTPADTLAGPTRFRSMHRILLMVATVAVLLGLAAPAALAADPGPSSRSFVLSVTHDADVPAGDHVDTLVVIRGHARIAGSVDSLVVVDGTATLTGATAGSVIVVRGSADLQAGTHVTGDVRTMDATVTRAAGVIVDGSTRPFDTDVAAFAVLLIPLFILLFVGFGLAGIAVALLVAAFGARQVREAEGLISREPGQVLIAGIIGSFVLPILAILVTVTIVGAPIGLGALLIVLPALALLGWIVSAIWVGEWILGRTRGATETGHPFLAAVLGVIVLAVAGIVPFVSAIATLFGFGALLLMGWRILRPPTTTQAPGIAGWTQPAANAS